MPRLPLVPARRVRRQLFAPMAAGMAARRIQAAARGFLARRRVAGMRRPRLLLSPTDIKKMKRRKTQGQIKNTTRAVMPKYRIGSLLGTAKSSRKVKGKMDPLVITEHDDRHATVSQPMVAYWGYSDAGSMDQQLEMGVRALVNMFVRRAGIKPCNINQTFNDSYLQDYNTFSSIKLNKIVIGYQGIAEDGTITRQDTEFAVAETDSVTTLSTTIMADIKQKALYSSAFAPVRAILQTNDSTTISVVYRTFATYDLQNVMIDFSYMRKYKWQNVTPADNTQSPGLDPPLYQNVNDINANPLSGKVYQFKHRVPQVRATQLDNVDLGRLSTIQNALGLDGALSTKAFRVADDFNSSLEYPFRQPFKAMQFFKDTKTEDKLYMPPGGYKQLIRKGNKTMNFARFVAATVEGATALYIRSNPGATVPDRIGTSTIWALEPVIRTATNETVRIATSMETWYTCKARSGTKTVPIVQINSVGAGTNFLT